MSMDNESSYFEYFKAQRDVVSTRTQDVLTLTRHVLDDPRLKITGDDRIKVERSIEGLEDTLRRLKEGKFQVAIVGQMKAGKSTLVNAMIFHQEVLPVASTPHTAKLTVIKHGDRPSAAATLYSREEWDVLRSRAIQAHTPTGALYAAKLETIRTQHGARVEELIGQTHQVPIHELDQYIAAYDPTIPQGMYTDITNLVEVTYPTSWPEEVEFVDTPGINDPDELREKVTYDYLTQADAVIMVIYAGRAGGREDLAFLSQQLLPIGLSKIMVVLNKIDMVPDDELNDVKSYLRNLLEENITKNERLGIPKGFREAMDVDAIFAVSGIRALLGRADKHIKDGKYYFKKTCTKKGIHTNEEAITQSGIEAFEDALERFLYEQKGKGLLRSPYIKSRGMLQILTMTIGDRVDRLDKKKQDLDRSRQELELELNRAHENFEHLERAFEEIRIDMRRKVNGAIHQDETQFEQKVRGFERSAVDLVSHSVAQFTRIDALTSQAHIQKLNTDLGWHFRAFLQDISDMHKRTLSSLKRTLQGDLKDDVRRKVPDYNESAQVRDVLDRITRIEIELGNGETRQFEDFTGLVASIKSALWIDEYRAAIEQKAHNVITECVKKGQRHAESMQQHIREQSMGHINTILDDIKRHYRVRLNDIKETISVLDSQQSDVDAKKAAIDDDIARLAELGAQVSDKIEESESHEALLR